VKTCDFSSQLPADCWEHAYLAALQNLETELTAREGLYDDSHNKCIHLTDLLGTKEDELTDAETTLGSQKAECDRDESNKTTQYCNFILSLISKVNSVCFNILKAVGCSISSTIVRINLQLFF